MLDVESGSVFEVDYATYFFVSCGEAQARDKFGDALIDEVKCELDELRVQGLLGTERVEPSKRRWDGAIKAMCLNVSHRCNMTCGYCFASGGDYGQAIDGIGHMSVDTALTAIEYLADNSGNRRNLEVDFFGGEPLLNMDAVRAAVSRGREIERKTDKRFRFTLTTNGALLTDDIIEFVNSEISNIVISIDGRPDVHNSVRKIRSGGGDSHAIVIDKTLELIKRRRAAKYREYYIRGTFTRDNLDFAEDVLYLKSKGFEHISMEPVVLPSAHPLAIRSEDIGRISREYERLAGLVRDNKISFFHFYLDLGGGPCESKRLVACGAGYEYVAVDPCGDIWPCHQFVGRDGYRMGSVVSGVDKDKAEELSRLTLNDKPKCKECWAKYYCGGGCHANAWNFNRDLQKPYELGCAIEKKRLECALWLKVKLSEVE